MGKYGMMAKYIWSSLVLGSMCQTIFRLRPMNSHLVTENDCFSFIIVGGKNGTVIMDGSEVNPKCLGLGRFVFIIKTHVIHNYTTQSKILIV